MILFSLSLSELLLTEIHFQRETMKYVLIEKQDTANAVRFSSGNHLKMVILAIESEFHAIQWFDW